MATRDHADLVIKPPILFLGALLLGVILSAIFPLGTDLASPSGGALALGLLLAGLGFALAYVSAQNFRKAGTDFVPGRPATALVVTGPYRWTRNPIYVGFTLVYLGLSLVLTSVWVLLLLVPVLAILQWGVVQREEAYLGTRFGSAYTDYCARVRRWL